MNIKDIKYFAHIRFSQLGYDVLYAETDKDEYFIPLVFEGNKDSKLKDKFLIPLTKTYSGLKVPTNCLCPAIGSVRAENDCRFL